MQNLLFCLISCCLLISCGNSSNLEDLPKDSNPLLAGSSSNANGPLFDGMYIEGQIINRAVDDDFGMIKIQKDHDYSYVTLYRGDELDNEKLGDKVYLKVDQTNGIPIANSLVFANKASFSPSQIYQHDPITRIRFHSFEKEDHFDYIHIRKHLSVGGNFSQATSLKPGPLNVDFDITEGGSFRLYGNEEIKQKIINFGEGEFWVKFSSDSLITQIDTCHRHVPGGEAFECRNN